MGVSSFSYCSLQWSRGFGEGGRYGERGFSPVNRRRLWKRRRFEGLVKVGRRFRPRGVGFGRSCRHGTLENSRMRVPDLNPLVRLIEEDG